MPTGRLPVLYRAENTPGPGYDHIAYGVILDAPDATPKQVAYFDRRREESSPVGDTLARNVHKTLEFV